MDMLGLDKQAALKAADIHAKLMNSGEAIDILDVLIAGIVMANDEYLVTKDINHFRRIQGLRCSSW